MTCAKCGLIALCTTAFGVGGCATTNYQDNRQAMIDHTADRVGCPPHLLKIQPQASTRSRINWLASGCKRSWNCSASRYGGVRCRLTRGARLRVLRRVLADRLAVESGCPAARIRMVAQSRFSGRGERLYRMRACGRFYVCTVFRRTVRCRLAAGQGAGSGGAGKSGAVKGGGEAEPPPAGPVDVHGGGSKPKGPY
jgi:hypothetical protein